MIYSTLVILPMYRQLYACNSLSLNEWKKCFIARARRAKKKSYKELFCKCHDLIFLAKVCGAKHVDVKSLKNSIKFIFDFSDEECMNDFTKKLADKTSFQI